MKKTIKKASNRGFTLIEILIVIGIIAVLAAIVLVAINPVRLFQKAADAQRSNDINAILNAVGQEIVEKKGVITSEIPEGNADDAKDISDDALTDADLCEILVPKHMAALPSDPKTSSHKGEGITEDECADGYNTGYTIWRDSNGRVTVTAQYTEVADANGDGVVDPLEVTR